ncbi:hypothetical protein [Lacticaseibacillus paracasei]|uniref:Uncharacterized protein n=1 Tax=Lacticaseibacillus paracasei NRIC 0644 TaxID=1435038 RepID=A0A0C9PUG8_LACPA|nr:hypothetical protein [Lacticaseibacillus paracasei]GAN35659.1 hypothetical protein LC0644_0248 [Lacticaseibacillus paracasei NRIC 0644]GAN38178.1 hypothetical protein LC1917_0055 [Lacticaseibacillus paracasei NRIC 1917]
MDKDEILAILKDPKVMNRSKELTMQERINKKSLSSSDKIEYAKDLASSGIVSPLKDILNGDWGDLFCDVVNFGEDAKKSLEDLKKALVLSEYVQKTDDNAKALSALTEFFSDPYGLSIYQKLSDLLSSQPADNTIVSVLSNILKNVISTGDYETNFSRNKSLIMLISKLTPQDLIVLNDITGLNMFKPETFGYSARGDIVKDDLSEIFASIYSSLHGADVFSTKLAFHDLLFNGLIVTKVIEGDQLGRYPTFYESLTDIGISVKKLIS